MSHHRSIDLTEVNAMQLGNNRKIADLVCPECQRIPLYPVQCIVCKNKAVYCSESEIALSLLCPICKAEQREDSFTTELPEAQFIINKLLFKCPNKCNKAKAHLKSFQFDAHVDQCRFRGNIKPIETFKTDASMRSADQEDSKVEEDQDQIKSLQGAIKDLKWRTDDANEQLDRLVEEEKNDKIHFRVNRSSFITLIFATIVAILIAAEYGKPQQPIPPNPIKQLELSPLIPTFILQKAEHIQILDKQIKHYRIETAFEGFLQALESSSDFGSTKLFNIGALSFYYDSKLFYQELFVRLAGICNKRTITDLVNALQTDIVLDSTEVRKHLKALFKEENELFVSADILANNFINKNYNTSDNILWQKMEELFGATLEFQLFKQQIEAAL